MTDLPAPSPRPVRDTSLLVVLTVFAFVASCFDVQNFDVWWHLKTGSLTVQNGAVFKTDPYSFASGRAMWVNSGWLAQVGMHYIFGWWSFPGLVIAKAAVIALCIPVLFAASRARGASAVAFGLCILWAVMAARFRFRVRPAVLSGLLCAVYVWLLDAHERKSTRWVWVLLPLMMLWVNVHPGFPAGFILLVLYFLSAAWRARHLRALIKPSPARTLMLLGLLSVVGALANPWTWRPFVYPLRLTAAKAFMGEIAEWAAPAFDRFYAPFWLYMLAGLVCVALTWRKLALSDGLVVAVFSAMAIGAVRHIFFFAIITVPVFAKHATALALGAMERWPRLSRARPQAALSALPFAVAAVLTVRLAVFDTIFPLGLRLREELIPKRAVDFIDAYGLPNNVCNAYMWGGYLSWRCYPRRQIHIDGRCLVYGEQKFIEYQNAISGKPGWEEAFAALNVNTVLLATNSLSKAGWRHPILSSPHWQPVYWDDTATVIVRKAPSTEAITRHPDSRLTHPALHDSHWADAALRPRIVEALERKLEAQPGCLSARVLLARSRGRMGDPAAAARALEAARPNAPANAALLNELAYWLAKANRHSEAIVAYRGLLKVTPGLPIAHYGIGSAHAARGEWIEAERSLRRALRVQSSFGPARLALIEVLQRQGKTAEAMEQQAALQASK